MIDIALWMNQFLDKLQKTFGDRVWFAGLQGSYARGEASEHSDIDVVIILDELSGSDIDAYHMMLDTMEHRDLICGFISGKKEIFNWEASDLFQFYYDTHPVFGSLDELLPLIDEAAVRRAIKTGACNIYHGCVHNMLHEHSEELLYGLYKSASFTVQAIVFLQTGSYIRGMNKLLTVTSSREKTVIETFMNLKQGGNVCFREMSDTLFDWAKAWIHNKTDL